MKDFMAVVFVFFFRRGNLHLIIANSPLPSRDAALIILDADGILLGDFVQRPDAEQIRLAAGFGESGTEDADGGRRRRRRRSLASGNAPQSAWTIGATASTGHLWRRRGGDGSVRRRNGRKNRAGRI